MSIKLGEICVAFAVDVSNAEPLISSLPWILRSSPYLMPNIKIRPFSPYVSKHMILFFALKTDFSLAMNVWKKLIEKIGEEILCEASLVWHRFFSYRHQEVIVFDYHMTGYGSQTTVPHLRGIDWWVCVSLVTMTTFRAHDSTPLMAFSSHFLYYSCCCSLLSTNISFIWILTLSQRLP